MIKHRMHHFKKLNLSILFVYTVQEIGESLPQRNIDKYMSAFIATPQSHDYRWTIDQAIRYKIRGEIQTMPVSNTRRSLPQILKCDELHQFPTELKVWNYSSTNHMARWLLTKVVMENKKDEDNCNSATKHDLFKFLYLKVSSEKERFMLASQPEGFGDPDHPEKRRPSEISFVWITQAPRAWSSDNSLDGTERGYQE
ncbi:hypothetical protein Tco_0417176 [Tanacetum coccineum]